MILIVEGGRRELGSLDQKSDLSAAVVQLLGIRLRSLAVGMAEAPGDPANNKPDDEHRKR